MQTCPKCQSQNVHRSQLRSKWEEWRKRITDKRLFRCQECQWRGWAPDAGPNFTDVQRAMAERALAPDPPNLRDTELSRVAKLAAPDMHKLDKFEEPQV